MAFFKRDKAEESNSVELVAYGQGLVVQGSPGAVAKFTEQVVSLTADSTGNAHHLVADGMAVAGLLDSKRNAHQEYFEFSPRAQGLLQEHGVIPTSDGWYRSFVKSDTQFAGNLDWKPLDIDPSQALSVQTAAVQLALRAAVNDITAAIERVEGKVDKLVTMAKAERLGNAAGDRFTLHSMAENTRSRGKISKTDWSSVAALGPQIARDIEALRGYIHSEITDAKNRGFGTARSAELKELTDELLKESLALLIVAEQNYALWQELRIAHVAAHEKDALASAVGDARAQLDALAEADQILLDALHSAAHDLLEPHGFEGFLPLERYRLQKRGGELGELTNWFAGQRHLDGQQFVIEYPSFRESANQTRATIGTTASTAGEAIGSAVGKMLRRNKDDDEEILELNEGESP